MIQDVSYVSFYTGNNVQNKSDYQGKANVEGERKEVSTMTVPTGETTSFLATSSLEEIQGYLEKNNIEDEDGTRSKALLAIQEFAYKIDPSIYNKMVDSLVSEETTSGASMRYSSFPTSDFLEKDPLMFNALISTTLNMEDTPHALIFTLNFNKDYSEYRSQNNISNKPFAMEKGSFDMDLDADSMTLMGFILKKLEEIEENIKQGNTLNQDSLLRDFKMFFGFFNDYAEGGNAPKINILA